MSTINNLGDYLTSIANAIRTKKGTTNPINAQNFAEEITSIISSGAEHNGKYLVQVIDYNGKVLKYDYLDAGSSFTLPNAPSHDGLVFEGYSSPIPIVNNAITVGHSDVVIGPMYHTISGKTEIDIELPTMVVPSITLNDIPADVTIDWGDGSSSITYMLSGTIMGANHTYSSRDEYTISLSGITSLSSTDKPACIKRVRTSSSVTSISDNAFKNCSALLSVAISNSVTSIGSYAFAYCYSLSSIVIPNSVTSIGSYAFACCYSLSSIVIPNSVTNISDCAFNICSSLKSIAVPGSITSFGNSAFRDSHAISRFDFTRHTTVPTVSNVYVFRSDNRLCKIIVPDSLYDQWIARSGWSSNTDYIYKASEV